MDIRPYHNRERNTITGEFTLREANDIDDNLILCRHVYLNMKRYECCCEKCFFDDLELRRDEDTKELLLVSFKERFFSHVCLWNTRGEHIRDYTSGDELQGVPQSVCSPPSHRGILLVCGRPSSTEELAICSTKRLKIFFFRVAGHRRNFIAWKFYNK